MGRYAHRVTAPRAPGVEVESSGLGGGGGELEIVLGSGRLVRVRGRVDAQWLGQVLGVVGAAPC